MSEPSRTPDDALFDEISALNNELVNAQRELAKKNAELERLYAEVKALSLTDTLTGAANRRGFVTWAERELVRARRYGHALGLAILDLDNFKDINDTHGHVIGDAVLVAAANRCMDELRQADVFARYGGDEFLLLMPETERAGAVEAAERAREAVSRPISVDDVTVECTVSVGVAMLDQGDRELGDLLHRADGALYRAKQRGRHRVVLDGAQ